MASASETPQSSSFAVRDGRSLDPVLGLLVVALAFLAASFAVRNSNFWLHLASGGLIAHGDYHFGQDPFAYTTDGVYWTNHSWLFDFAVFSLYNLASGAGLVIVKGLAIALLAFLLIQAGGRGWPAVSCVALAVLAMSPQLLLQPAIASFVLLGLSLWLLTRRGRRYLLMPVICLVWVNLDAWFLLGALLVGLMWLGGRLAKNSTDESPRLPGWLCPACIAACLLNPHHIHAFAIPADLAIDATASALRDDVRFHSLFTSPWQFDQLLWSAGTIKLAGWAFVVLAGLGVVSFLFNIRNLSAWRLFVWLAFAGLGAWNGRTAPFFAIVAGPITALNLRDAIRRSAITGRVYAVGAMTGRFGLLAGIAGLLVIAWVGWLQGFGHDGSRRVAWRIEPDASLVRMCESVQRLREQGLLGAPDHGFALHPDVANYAAWFCPDEKGFLDGRLPLFRAVARDYADLCRELNPALLPSSKQMNRNWRQVLRDRRISHLLLYDPEFARLAPAVVHVIAHADEWEILRIDGNAVLVGWKPARSFAGLALDVDRLAFAPPIDADAILPPAPGEGPGGLPLPDNIWTRLGKAACLPTWESGAARVYVSVCEAAAPQEQMDRLSIMRNALAASLIGRAAVPGWVLRPTEASPIVLRMLPPPDFGGPPAPALLAVRAARRAIAACPEDASARLALGQAYLLLGRFTDEILHPSPPLAMLRHAQTVAALRSALVRNPDLPTAHRHLADLFEDRGFLDEALTHRKEFLRLAIRDHAPADRVNALREQVDRLESTVQDRRQLFAIRAETLGDNPLAKAHEALRLGLAAEALDRVLLKAEVIAFGGEAARLQVQLLLELGHAPDAGVVLDQPGVRNNPQRFGFHEMPFPGIPGPGFRLPAYTWLRACQAAAVGDYDRASATLQTLITQTRDDEQKAMPYLQKHVPTALAAATGAQLAMGALALRAQTAEDIRRMIEVLRLARALRPQWADLSVVAALLELERGRPDLADGLLREALGAGEVFPARRLANDYLRRIETAKMGAAKTK